MANMETVETALVTIDNDNLTRALLDKGEMTKILDGVKTALDAFSSTTDSVKGRKSIASIAYKVAQTKTTIDNFGKTLVADAKSKIKVVDDIRKMARDTLDEYRDEVRVELTAWEDSKSTTENLIKSLNVIAEMPGESFNTLDCNTNEIAKVLVDECFEDLRELVAVAIQQAKEAISEKRIAIQKGIDDAAELERLRKAEVDRVAKEKRDADIKAAAAKLVEDQRTKTIADVEKARAAPANVSINKPYLTGSYVTNFPVDTDEKSIPYKDGKTTDDQEKNAPAPEAQTHESAVRNAAYSSFMAHGFSHEMAYGLVVAIAASKIANVSLNY